MVYTIKKFHSTWDSKCCFYLMFVKLSFQFEFYNKDYLELLARQRLKQYYYKKTHLFSVNLLLQVLEMISKLFVKKKKKKKKKCTCNL